MASASNLSRGADTRLIDGGRVLATHTAPKTTCAMLNKQPSRPRLLLQAGPRVPIRAVYTRATCQRMLSEAQPHARRALCSMLPENEASRVVGNASSGFAPPHAQGDDDIVEPLEAFWEWAQRSFVAQASHVDSRAGTT